MLGLALALLRLIRLSILALFHLPILALLIILRSGSAPRVLRNYLTRSGAAFIKLGQVLALRYDMLPIAYCRELESLLDEVPPAPIAAVQRALERELGPSAQTIVLEPKPLGSASLAQVHRARLQSGEDVAIKVLRPGIERMIAVDLFLLRVGTATLDAMPFFGSFQLRPISREIDRLMREELDLEHEARSAELVRKLLESDEIDHRAPRIFFEYTTRRVLTMELFLGVWVRDLMSAVDRGDTAQLEAWRERGISPERVSRLIFRSFLVQAYRHRVFHADPHPGNLVIMEGGTLGYVDFGMVGWLDERIWGQQYRFFEAIAEGRVHASYVAMIDIVNPSNAADLELFEREYKDLLLTWLSAAKNTNTAWLDRSSGGILFRTTLVMQRARIRLPSETLRLHRAALVSDMVELRLHPKLDVAAEMLSFFNAEGRRRLVEALQPDGKILGRLVRIARTLQLVEEVGPAALQWASANLPAILRTADRQISRMEKTVGMFLGYCRAAVLATIPIVLLSWQLPLIPSVSNAKLAQLIARISPDWDLSLVSLWCVVALIVATGLKRMSAHMRAM